MGMDNKQLDLVCGTGGSLRVTIPGTPFKVQANSGTTVECRQCWLVCKNGSSNIRVQIGEACTATTGIPVPELGTGSLATTYLNLPISDLANLYFIGEVENDVVDILYVK